MKRRSLLGGLAATAATAGCLQGLDTTDLTQTTTGDGDTGGSTTEPTNGRTGADTPPEADPADEWDPDRSAVETLSYGDRDAVAFPDNNRPHGVHLWNRADSSRDVRVGVVAGASEDADVLGPVTAAGDGLLQLDLQAPTRYELTVWADGVALGSVVVERRWFDCNHSTSRYALDEGSLVDFHTESTLIGCPSPSIAAVEIAVLARDCGTEDDEAATVTYGDENVAVSGTFVAGSPCSQLSIGSGTYDAESRTARVVVEADEDEEGGCVNCVGAIDYEATVAFEDDFPDFLTLVHRGVDGEERVVELGARNGDPPSRL